jgi:hypothetical protein
MTEKDNMNEDLLREIKKELRGIKTILSSICVLMVFVIVMMAIHNMRDRKITVNSFCSPLSDTTTAYSVTTIDGSEPDTIFWKKDVSAQ